MRKSNVYSAWGIIVLSTMLISACQTNQTEKPTESTTIASSLEESSLTEKTSLAPSEAAKEENVKSSEAAKESNAPLAEGDGPAFHMKETKSNLPADKAPDPNAKNDALIAVFLPSEGFKGIYMDFGSVPSLGAQEVVNQLVEYKVLPEQSTVLAFEMDQAKAKLNLVGLDLADRRKVVCVANTFIENFNLESITIVAGDETSASTENLTFVSDLEEVQ